MPTRDELTQQQKNQWSSAALGWERWGDWFDRNAGALTRWMCDHAQLSSGHQVLDLACGTGQPSAEAAMRVGPTGHVIATDISPDMVEVTRRKAAKMGLTNINVREMDAHHIAFPDASFDAVTCRFALMLCADPVKVASDVHRVLRPGGRFVAVVWDVPAKNPFFTSIGQVVQQFVGGPPPDPTAPGVFRLAPPGELDAVLKAGGFSNVTIESHPMTFTYDSPAHYWQVQSDIVAPLKGAMANLGPADLDRLKTAVMKAVEPFTGSDGKINLTATPLRAVAVKG